MPTSRSSLNSSNRRPRGPRSSVPTADTAAPKPQTVLVLHATRIPRRSLPTTWWR